MFFGEIGRSRLYAEQAVLSSDEGLAVLLFVNMSVLRTLHRGQLRRVACQNVRPYTPGGKASLLLLQRERTSLVPIRASPGGDLGGEVGGGTKIDVPPRTKSGALEISKVYIPGGGVEDSRGADEEGWSADACPKEGDESERFSRLVRANPR